MARKTKDISDRGISSGPKRRDRKVYSGESLRCAAMPMGGIGTGSIALCGDGSLRQWQIFNQVNHLCFVPGCLFAIRARTGWHHGVSRLLLTPVAHGEEGFTPAPGVNDHVVPEELKDILARFPGVRNVEYVGEYPIAQLRYVSWKLIPHHTIIPPSIQVSSFWRGVCGIDPTT